MYISIEKRIEQLKEQIDRIRSSHQKVQDWYTKPVVQDIAAKLADLRRAQEDGYEYTNMKCNIWITGKEIEQEHEAMAVEYN